MSKYVETALLFGLVLLAGPPLYCISPAAAGLSTAAAASPGPLTVPPSRSAGLDGPASPRVLRLARRDLPYVRDVTRGVRDPTALDIDSPRNLAFAHVNFRAPFMETLSTAFFEFVAFEDGLIRSFEFKDMPKVLGRDDPKPPEDKSSQGSATASSSSDGGSGDGTQPKMTRKAKRDNAGDSRSTSFDSGSEDGTASTSPKGSKGPHTTMYLSFGQMRLPNLYWTSYPHSGLVLEDGKLFFRLRDFKMTAEAQYKVSSKQDPVVRQRRPLVTGSLWDKLQREAEYHFEYFTNAARKAWAAAFQTISEDIGRVEVNIKLRNLEIPIILTANPESHYYEIALAESSINGFKVKVKTKSSHWFATFRLGSFIGFAARLLESFISYQALHFLTTTIRDTLPPFLNQTLQHLFPGYSQSVALLGDLETFAHHVAGSLVPEAAAGTLQRTRSQALQVYTRLEGNPEFPTKRIGQGPETATTMRLAVKAGFCGFRGIPCTSEPPPSIQGSAPSDGSSSLPVPTEPSKPSGTWTAEAQAHGATFEIKSAPHLFSMINSALLLFAESINPVDPLSMTVPATPIPASIFTRTPNAMLRHVELDKLILGDESGVHYDDGALALVLHNLHIVARATLEKPTPEETARHFPPPSAKTSGNAAHAPANAGAPAKAEGGGWFSWFRSKPAPPDTPDTTDSDLGTSDASGSRDGNANGVSESASTTDESQHRLAKRSPALPFQGPASHPAHNVQGGTPVTLHVKAARVVLPLTLERNQATGALEFAPIMEMFDMHLTSVGLTQNGFSKNMQTNSISFLAQGLLLSPWMQSVVKSAAVTYAMGSVIAALNGPLATLFPHTKVVIPLNLGPQGTLASSPDKAILNHYSKTLLEIGMIGAPRLGRKGFTVDVFAKYCPLKPLSDSPDLECLILPGSKERKTFWSEVQATTKKWYQSYRKWRGAKDAPESTDASGRQVKLPRPEDPEDHIPQHPPFLQRLYDVTLGSYNPEPVWKKKLGIKEKPVAQPQSSVGPEASLT